jgi:branched-subunit amino acid aminotransferase/4-amino-4-deoxychorismate lyase
MRAYWSDADQQLYVFRLREHLRRLERSAKIARIPLPADAAGSSERRSRSSGPTTSARTCTSA